MIAGERAEAPGGEPDAEPGGAGLQAGTAAEPMPRVLLTRRRIIASLLFVLLGVGFLYFVLPKLTGVGKTVHRIEGGDSWWIAIGVLLELLSFAGYVVLFRAVFVRGHDRIGWRESYEITMAGLVATRLFAAAGAGGVALTAWALRRSGMEPRLVACRMVAFIVLLYIVYAGSLLLAGIGLGTGLFPGGGSFAITIVPAIAAAVLVTVAGAAALLPGDIERRLARWASGSGRIAVWVARGATVPALAASLVGLRHQRPVSDVPRLRLAAAVHRHLDGLLRRHARQPAAAPRRPRRRRGRHDRRVRRLRRRRQPVGAGRALLPRHRLLAADASGGRRLLPAAPHRRALA
jgi:hypothetical protein